MKPIYCFCNISHLGSSAP